MNKSNCLKIDHIVKLVGNEYFRSVLKHEFNYLEKNFPQCNLKLIETKFAAIEANVLNRASIKWKRFDSLPRVPDSIQVDIRLLYGVDLFLALLHEFGHLKDFDNELIVLNTNRSEISAWKNVIELLQRFGKLATIYSETERAIGHSLLSYSLPSYSIEELQCIRICKLESVIICEN